MRSVADALRRETMAADAARTPAERLANAFRLGDSDARTMAQAQGISEAEARRRLARQRQQGRVRSGCHESLLG